MNPPLHSAYSTVCFGIILIQRPEVLVEGDSWNQGNQNPQSKHCAEDRVVPLSASFDVCWSSDGSPVLSLPITGGERRALKLISVVDRHWWWATADPNSCLSTPHYSPVLVQTGCERGSLIYTITDDAQTRELPHILRNSSQHLCYRSFISKIITLIC